MSFWPGKMRFDGAASGGMSHLEKRSVCDGEEAGDHGGSG